MAIDTTPSTVATNALQAIPYGALIGGPLKAAIEAQAMAAKTTWEFIKEVGLNPPDAEGNRTAVQVVFQYQKGGQIVNLIVPILAIVPIPYIAIREIDIDFLANISASSSSVKEESSSIAAEAEAEASARVGWGPFSLEASFKANFSSKKDSKATEESRYSVEYTMTVAVRARQDDMPAGLATILNILQSSITEANPEGSLVASPHVTGIDIADPEALATVLATLRDSMGLAVTGDEVTYTLTDTGMSDAFEVKAIQGTEKEAWTGGTIKIESNDKGMTEIEVKVKDKTKITERTAEFNVTATVEEKVKEDKSFINFSNIPPTP